MRAAPDDLTGSARIRDAAMHLFAERGFAATSIRDIAAQAGVSSSLVVHHFGTKARLKDAADARLITGLTQMLADLTAADSPTSAEAFGSIAQTLRDEPDLLAYLRRMLVDGGEAATSLFLGIVEALASELAAQEAAGIVLPSVDPRTRAVFLIVNDLGAIVLRDLVERALGVDPFSAAGIQQWGAVVMEAYTRGVYASPPAPEADRPDVEQERDRG